MTITFTVKGQPKGKGRPRFSSGHTYTPQTTKDYEDLIKLEFKQQCGSIYYSAGVPLSVEVLALFKIPKANKEKTAQMKSGELLPVGKPDLDNIIKTLDALNGVAWADDSQIVNIKARKYYSENPMLIISISENQSGGKK